MKIPCLMFWASVRNLHKRVSKDVMLNIRELLKNCFCFLVQRKGKEMLNLSANNLKK